MANKRRKSLHKKSSSLLYFVSFILLGILTALVLEYIDFKKGKDTFLLKRILQRSEETDQQDGFNRRLTHLLENEGVRFKYFKGDDDLFHFKLDIGTRDPSPFTAQIEAITASLGLDLNLSEIQKTADGETQLFFVSVGGTNTHIILVNRQILSQPVPGEDEIKPKDQKPKIAFIIDDIGNRPGVASELKKLNIPISASILPDTPFAVEEAEFLRKSGLEAMIHLPMVPKNSHNYGVPKYPVIQPSSGEGEIREIVQKAKKRVPYARGVNNHEGSLVTSQSETMSRILKILKAEGLFFVDSRTSVDTVAYDIAKKLKIKTAARDVFLDSVKSYDFSREQIQRLVKIARRKGRGVAIGHPLESTIRAIKDAVPSILSSGIEIVFVSQILE